MLHSDDKDPLLHKSAFASEKSLEDACDFCVKADCDSLRLIWPCSSKRAALGRLAKLKRGGKIKSAKAYCKDTVIANFST